MTTPDARPVSEERPVDSLITDVQRLIEYGSGDWRPMMREVISALQSLRAEVERLTDVYAVCAENFRHEVAATLRALASRKPREGDTRQCTCHPDDNPPVPCPRKYALSECRQAAIPPADVPGAAEHTFPPGSLAAAIEDAQRNLAATPKRYGGGAHQLIKLHHADAMKLYAALKLVRPNHPLVDELRQSYCEIWRAGGAAGQCTAMKQGKEGG